MKNLSIRFLKKYMRTLCLLLIVGILCICVKMPVHATSSIDSGERHITGTTEERTNINEPGSSEDPEELK